ncbi:OpgC family protein [Algicella marina]|nr:OpgC domain-containing protein [Algicella marina]
MFIILLAHTPGNPWTRWIPARWGFSDATEIFVFCSGMASAIAFGAVFERHGLAMGAVRTAHRVWQVYWAHIGMFMVIAMSMIMLNAIEFLPRDYVGQLNLYPFFENPIEQLIGLMTLTYVPNYFDILPMYLAILAMIPLVMALKKIGTWAVIVAVLTLWCAANVGRYFDLGFAFLEPLAVRLEFLHLPAQLWFEPPNNTREWFFNPFAWQLVFFTGFCLMKGWIPAPPVNRYLLVIAAAVVVLAVPFSNVGVREFGLDSARNWRIDHQYLIIKTDFGLFRYLHFLALAYVAWVMVGPKGARLNIGTVWPRVVAVIRKVGQQSLAVFLTSMLLARFLGAAFDVWREFYINPGTGEDGMSSSLWVQDVLFVALVNITGFAILIATAYFVGWIKRNPWKAEPAEKKLREPEPVSVLAGENAA